MNLQILYIQNFRSTFCSFLDKLLNVINHMNFKHVNIMKFLSKNKKNAWVIVLYLDKYCFKSDNRVYFYNYIFFNKHDIRGVYSVGTLLAYANSHVKLKQQGHMPPLYINVALVKF